MTWFKKIKSLSKCEHEHYIKLLAPNYGFSLSAKRFPRTPRGISTCKIPQSTEHESKNPLDPRNKPSGGYSFLVVLTYHTCYKAEEQPGWNPSKELLISPVMQEIIQGIFAFYLLPRTQMLGNLLLHFCHTAGDLGIVTSCCPQLNLFLSQHRARWCVTSWELPGICLSGETLTPTNWTNSKTAWSQLVLFRESQEQFSDFFSFPRAFIRYSRGRQTIQLSLLKDRKWPQHFNFYLVTPS